jgi:D-3-phosphoglycerate dehydrogenase
MGMKIIGYDPVMNAEALKEVSIKKVELADIWAQSDIITIHTPLTPETSNLINDANLAKCKKGVQIINCARGGIVDEAALLKGLESGQVAGAALDVFTSEPPKEHLKPLISHPNLVCTPRKSLETFGVSALTRFDRFGSFHGRGSSERSSRYRKPNV